MSKKEKTTVETSDKPKKKRGKVFLKVLGVILCVIIVFVAITTLVTVFGNKATMNKAKSFEPVVKEDVIVPEKDADGNWTFTTDRQLKVLQLTDVHIGGGWMCLKKDSMAINAVAAMVTAEKPDLVIVTGDVSYPVPFQAGTFNNKSSAKIFAALMEQLGVYWTMAMGNHDTELYSYYTREQIGDYYENSGLKYCLFKQGDENVDGAGNQVINVKNSDGIITQSLFTFDSHSYIDGDYFGIMWKYDNIHENQIKWYSETLDKLNAENDKIYKQMNSDEKSDIKSLAFFHIPMSEQKTAWNEYVANGYKDTEDTKLVYGGIGESGQGIYCGIHEDELFETMLEKGSTKGVFFGHDHYNNASINYKGIRLTYGMSVDYLAYPGIYKQGAQRGCTVIEVNPDGSFDCRPENYYQDKYTSLYDKESVNMAEPTYQSAEVTNEQQ
ncbi:MAG: metallophosphoesterase [Faecalibacterium sp.]|nr:metallophosphoesterase [Ruminococcus sp.]MCM1391976.1 metallophosphoesterase [Ruminococcus sp.]MCM1485065.1 metallophosphoesterase [Faecalibacterium sp.]